MSRPTPDVPMGLDPLRWWSRVDPARRAVIEARGGRTYSYGELDAGAARWRDLLGALQLAPGDRVAVMSGNRREVVELLYACRRAGVVLVPLNWRLSAPELARVIADARPAVVLGEARYAALAAAAGVTEAHWLDLDRPPAVPHECAGMDDAPLDPVAMILYTSGSTGAPKGAMISHRQIAANAFATTSAWELGPADVAPVATPVFHTGAWHVFTTPLLAVGGTIVLHEAFDADALLHSLAAHGCTVAFVVPTQLVMLMQRPAWSEPLPALRYMISGGAPCPARLSDAVRARGIAFREGFGLTECGPNCFAITDAMATAKTGSVGWPVPMLEMRLTGEDGAEVPTGAVGELELRGPQLFAGYFRDPARTAEAFSADGWLRTGDLACRDADGAFSIRGRRKEMFISGGENVFPGEVESALLECAGVAEVAVVGVPDDRWGEVGCAVIVRAAFGDEVGDAELSRLARERLAGYKVPKRYLFVRELPRLGSGKIDRRALADLCAASVTATPAAMAVRA